ncbi:hypothetical protein [Burkholderia phage vB_BglM_WTB]
MAYKRMCYRGANTRIPTGFSVTTLLFSFWPSVFRGHFGYAAIVFGVEMLVTILMIALGSVNDDAGAILFFLFFVVRIFFAFQRNSELERFFKLRGWVCPDEDEDDGNGQG